MTLDDQEVSISPTELYRPRRYAETYQGLDGWPVSELVAQEKARDYSQHLALIGGPGEGKTSLARIRGARRGCENYLADPVEPCGKCDHCRQTVAGMNSRLGAYHEIDCASGGWLEELETLIRAGIAYRPVWGRSDSKLSRIILLDELQRVARNVQQSLLKTIEDALRIQFIICTTDQSGILPELLDRCLKLQLQKPTAEQFSTWLGGILRREGISWDEGVLGAFDRGTRRGIRQSLLNIRPLTRTAKHLTEVQVRKHFGISAAGSEGHRC